MMQPPDSVWTEDKIAELTRLWEDGVTTVEIGKQIGVSKNAVIGKVHRIGLTPRVVKEVPVSPTVLNLRGGQCRYPIGHPGEPDFHFCSADAKSASPYCARHHAVCYETEDSVRRRNASIESWTDERRSSARKAWIARNGGKSHEDEAAD